MPISIEVIEEDALKIQADVLILKYAQANYGVDKLVSDRLSKLQPNLFNSLPSAGNFLLINTCGSLGTEEVLFVGVEPLYDFRYQKIRDFAHRALLYLSHNSPSIETVCFTIHGAGYGLDINEAFQSEIAGIIDSLSKNEFPRNLKQIIIVEQNKILKNRLSEILEELFPQGVIKINEGDFSNVNSLFPYRLKNVGYQSEKKPLVFVAMPFDKNMYDVFYYGIKGAVNKAGYLCERADEAFFSGEIIDWVKKRIVQADIVLADLTHANPNVYLEVGFSWGNNKQTILIAQDPNELRFNVRGQKCLIYKSIKQLEDLLRHEFEKI